MASAADIENRWAITGALMLATVMNTLDSTIANTALPHMQGSLGAAQDQIVWVLTSYIIATAIMTPLSGWLSLKIGRKPMFLVSISAFTLASMACGAAQNLPEMVLFRLIQGIAGATLMPLSQTVMLDIFPYAQIPRVMSIWSSAVIMGPIIGPVLGGWITENFTWRYCFYINLPIGILAFLGVLVFMERDRGGRQRPFDFLGFGALVAFVGAFQLMMDRGPSQDWFGSTEIWTYLVIACLGLWIFIIQTLSARQPFFHRDLARDRNFVSTTFFSLFVGALLFSTSAVLPQFMQNILGYTAYQSGLASMPRGVGSLISFMGVPYLITLIGPRRTIIGGIVLCVAALWQMAHFDLSMTSRPIVVSGFVQGMGIGLLFAPLNVLAYATLDPVHRTEGTIVATMARSLGSSLGISAVQASVIRDITIAHARLAEHIVPGNPVVDQALQGPIAPGAPGGIALLDAYVSRQAAMIGYDTVFAWMTLAILLLAPMLVLMRPPAAQAGVTVQSLAGAPAKSGSAMAAE
ncbi:MAG TPA: DHA2 family efflux MFS transporter permease subunit [Caulobacteraceae bacterium]|nr:DHA2 family efflux MFS transporter permease subunit [Caulobacteraceae bacterium]